MLLQCRAKPDMEFGTGDTMSATTVAAPSSAPKAAWICLAIAWACFVLPIPGIGLVVGWPLNLVAFILAIVAMAKRGASAGLWQLLASLVVSPIMYFIGLGIMAGIGGVAAQSAGSRPAHQQTAAPAQAEAPVAAKEESISIDARALHAAYGANEVAADAQFKGKSLLVSGPIEAIDSGFGDEPVVRLSAGDFDSVMVKGLPKATAASLSKGQQISVLCTGDGEIIGSPVLDECSLQ